MVINKFHKSFISSNPIHDFCRRKNIAFSSYNLDDLVNRINELVSKGELDSSILENELEDWIYQGRKKIVFKYLNSDVLKEIRNINIFKEIVKSQLKQSNEITSLSNLKGDVESKDHLINIKYKCDSDNNLNEVIFLFVKIVKHVETTKYKRLETPFPIPVYVTIDFINNEIYSRVNAKSNIYNFNDEKLRDKDIATYYIEALLIDLGLSAAMGVSDREIIKKTIYETHTKITKIPEKVIESVGILDEDIINFVSDSSSKLGISMDEKHMEEINESIKNLFIKEFIMTLTKSQKDIFILENSGYSTAITVSSRSFSKLRHSSPGGEALHLLPEYQNIRPVLEESGEIDRNTIYWISKRKPTEYIRSKLFINNKGYGIISFEEYVYEEDIKNVFSKIRESKPRRSI